MELEDQKKIEMCLENIIRWEGRIIEAKIDYKSSKSTCENEIKRTFHHLSYLKRRALLKQQGLEWSCADDTLCDEEGEKEFQRWKNLTPGEKIKEHKENSRWQKEEEDWEPMTDIQVGRWIEEEIEKN